MSQLRPIDINTKHHRATYLILEDKAMFFGLAIRREKNSHVDRWAFYVGITEEEYNFFLGMQEHHGNPTISFLGMASEAISVSKILADTLMIEQPQRFIGCHYDKDPFNDNWSNASIYACLDYAFGYVRGMLKHEKTPSSLGIC